MQRYLHRSRLPAVLSVAALVYALLAMPAAQAGSYTFAVRSTGYPAYYGAPSINDFGHFDYGADDGNGFKIIIGADKLQAIWPDDDGSVFPGNGMSTNDPNPFATSVYHVVVGADQAIMFDGAFLASSTGDFFRFGYPVINDAGRAAFFARRDDGGSGVYVGNLSTGISPIALSGSLFNSLGEVISINNSGEVALVARSGSFQAIVVTADGIDNQYVATSGGQFSAFYYPSINDDGDVVFSATPTAGGIGVYLKENGGTISTIADDSGPFVGFGLAVINNRGDVAFDAVVDDGGHLGVFTGGDPVADKVVQVGDPLFGSTLSNLKFHRGLNNHGQIAFRYALANGEQGIAVATPVVVAEATSLALALIALGATAVGRQSRPHGAPRNFKANGMPREAQSAAG